MRAMIFVDIFKLACLNLNINDSALKIGNRDFPGGPVVKTLHFHCRGYGFDPWSGN